MLLGKPLLLRAWRHCSQNSFYPVHKSLARIAGTNLERLVVATCGHELRTPFLSPAHGRRSAKQRRDPAVIRFGLPIRALFLKPDAVFAGNAHITDRKIVKNGKDVPCGNLQGVPLLASPDCFLFPYWSHFHEPCAHRFVEKSPKKNGNALCGSLQISPTRH